MAVSVTESGGKTTYSSNIDGVELVYNANKSGFEYGIRVWDKDLEEVTRYSYRDHPKAHAVFQTLHTPENLPRLHEAVNEIMALRMGALFKDDKPPFRPAQISEQRLKDVHTGIYGMLRAKSDIMGAYIGALSAQAFYRELEK